VLVIPSSWGSQLGSYLPASLANSVSSTVDPARWSQAGGSGVVVPAGDGRSYSRGILAGGGDLLLQWDSPLWHGAGEVAHEG
jgi:uncharacterized protein RhaS with RHS repeats